MNSTNERLFERAYQVKSYFEGTDLELAINKAIEDNDLERLEYMVKEAEAEISRQEFHNNETYPGTNFGETTDAY
jgi:hypothetical protein